MPDASPLSCTTQPLLVTMASRRSLSTALHRSSRPAPAGKDSSLLDCEASTGGGADYQSQAWEVRMLSVSGRCRRRQWRDCAPEQHPGSGRHRPQHRGCACRRRGALLRLLARGSGCQDSLPAPDAQLCHPLLQSCRPLYRGQAPLGNTSAPVNLIKHHACEAHTAPITLLTW